MGNLRQHAEMELQMTGFLSKDSDYNGMIGEAVLELIDKLAEQQHSGASAGIVVSLFEKLARYEPLGPLTGEDEEWHEIHKGFFQNKRLGSVFKHEDGRCTYNEAVVKRCANGATWTGPLYLTKEDAINNVNQIMTELKGFPFTPKTIYIDVLEEEVEPNNWIMWVKDPKQLDEVWEHYNQIENV